MRKERKNKKKKGGGKTEWRARREKTPEGKERRGRRGGGEGLI